MEQKRGGLLGWLEARVNLTEIVSFLTVFGLLPVELDSRKPLKEALREAMSQPLPNYARWPQVIGVLSFILFIFLAVSGTMLAFYYQPTADVAYPSVTLIARDISFGNLTHQVHHWAAVLFLILLGARVVRFFFARLYHQGREVVWIVAVLTFMAATIADLTGRLLPWDARGYWTTVRAREVTDALPLLGPFTSFLVGGSGLDSLVLTRYYVLHVVVFPLVLLGLFYFHFSSVRRVGLSRTEPTGPGVAPSGVRSLQVVTYELILLNIVMVGVLLSLAVLAPYPFDVMADPFNTPPNARPPWYLLAPHALLEAFPAWVPRTIRGIFPEAILLAVIFVPFLGPGSADPVRRRRFRNIGYAMMVLWVVLTAVGWMLEVRR
ncbi:MAG: cytochrome b N-terminal domain-containing protein [Bacteroidota bacterium]